MSAFDGKCDRCGGTGKVELALFFSVVTDTCPDCNGNGIHVYMCPKCKAEKALITRDLTGMSHINVCNRCASQDGVASTHKVKITYKVLSPVTSTHQ